MMFFLGDPCDEVVIFRKFSLELHFGVQFFLLQTCAFKLFQTVQDTVFSKARFKCSRKDQAWTSISWRWTHHGISAHFSVSSFPFRFGQGRKGARSSCQSRESRRGSSWICGWNWWIFRLKSFHIMFVWRFVSSHFQTFQNLSGFWWSLMAGECGATKFSGILWCFFYHHRIGTKVTDLHRVMEVAKSLWLLLEHSNEVGSLVWTTTWLLLIGINSLETQAMVRVALEIALDGTYKKVLWWPDFWRIS